MVCGKQTAQHKKHAVPKVSAIFVHRVQPFYPAPPQRLIDVIYDDSNTKNCSQSIQSGKPLFILHLHSSPISPKCRRKPPGQLSEFQTHFHIIRICSWQVAASAAFIVGYLSAPVKRTSIWHSNRPWTIIKPWLQVTPWPGVPCNSGRHFKLPAAMDGLNPSFYVHPPDQSA